MVAAASTTRSALATMRRLVSSSSSGKSVLLAPSRGIHASALQQGGAAASPPLPPFARIPPRSEPMVENSDVIWDDGVAPELALDFDAPHISSREGLATWATGLFGFFALYQTIRFVTNGATDDNPALIHASDVVDVNHADHAAVAAAAAAKK